MGSGQRTSRAERANATQLDQGSRFEEAEWCWGLLQIIDGAIATPCQEHPVQREYIILKQQQMPSTVYEAITDVVMENNPRRHGYEKIRR